MCAYGCMSVCACPQTGLPSFLFDTSCVPPRCCTMSDLHVSMFYIKQTRKRDCITIIMKKRGRAPPQLPISAYISTSPCTSHYPTSYHCCLFFSNFPCFLFYYICSCLPVAGNNQFESTRRLPLFELYPACILFYVPLLSFFLTES